MRGKKILFQLIFAVVFFAVTVKLANQVLADSSLELNLMFDFVVEAAQKLGINLTLNNVAKDYINERTQLLTDMLIGAEYLGLFWLTARRTRKYSRKIENPRLRKRNHFRFMFAVIILCVLAQMMFLNVREFNSGSIITIDSIFIPTAMLSFGVILAGLFVGKRVGVHYVIPKKARAEQ